MKNVNKPTTFRWFSRFKNEMELGKDEKRVGRPILHRNPEKEETGIPKSLVGSIIKEDLQLKKTPSKFATKMLTIQQKENRVEVAKKMLEMVEENPNWKEKVITGDETWVYGYDPETKRQSMEWKGKDETRTKKSRLCKSKNKVLLVTFFDINGIVHYEYLEEAEQLCLVENSDDLLIKYPSSTEIVAYRDCELSFREIGSRIGQTQTTVMRICDRWMQEGTTDRRVRSHPLQCPTPRADRQIVHMGETDRSVTSRTVAEHIQSATHHPASARSIRSRLEQIVCPQDVH
ncbi:hypothetical protein LAZ67_3001207 [Cordylochernes scorpioides]|uniref:Transposase n=1 Tax=Cordylochernes scorpioides TaxID=51811 RepID=A0ABY6K9R5_9ARAC|nr:hypothetical protein LAZ67_3001207 [Cordylochernes scorpioides]